MDTGRAAWNRWTMMCACLALQAGNAAAQAHIFMTSSTGTGELSSWSDAGGAIGLQAADAVCQARAAAASLEGADDYVAWLSDSADDAYCRAHGFDGTRAAQCGQAAEPTGAGPWSRIDGLPAMDVLPLSMEWSGSPGYQPRHVLFDETGQPIPLGDIDQRTDLAFTATDAEGRYSGGGSCGDWTSDSGEVLLGSAYYGFGGFSSFMWDCDRQLRLICLRKGEHGAPIARHLPPTARMVFVSGTTGNGDLGSWPQAGSATGLDAGDAICRSEAAAANLPLAASYKAWLSSADIDARERFEFDGPWYRVDGVRVAASIVDLLDGFIDAPIQVDANGSPLGFESVWTGTGADGLRTGLACASWSSTSGSGTVGATAAAETRWSQGFFNAGCSAGNLRLYCLADNDSLYFDGFD
jgi:hypothetical protein